MPHDAMTTAVESQPQNEINPLVLEILKLFAYEHLPLDLQAASKPFHDLAWQMANTGSTNRELLKGFDRLLEAKDCFVRSMLT